MNKSNFSEIIDFDVLNDYFDSFYVKGKMTVIINNGKITTNITPKCNNKNFNIIL